MPDRYDLLREYYADFAHHEDQARRVAWRNIDDQLLRFEVLIEAIDDRDYPLSVLDVGCGVGRLFGYLTETGRATEYTGIDLLPFMVEQARVNYPEARFLVADLLGDWDEGSYDLVVCSGSLNIKVTQHEGWVQQMLRAMWDRAKLAVAANFQTTRAHDYIPSSKDNDDIYYVDRTTLLNWCDPISPWITLREDYLGDDTTVYLYKHYHRSVGRLEHQQPTDDRTDEQRACSMASLLLEQKRPELALDTLEGVEPTVDVLNFRGLCYHHLGKHREARVEYAAALERDPDHTESRLSLEWLTEND